MPNYVCIDFFGNVLERFDGHCLQPPFEDLELEKTLQLYMLLAFVGGSYVDKALMSNGKPKPFELAVGVFLLEFDAYVLLIC